MNKSESSGVGAATKRPSARRVTTESELPAAEATGKIPRRVHVRRPHHEGEPAEMREADDDNPQGLQGAGQGSDGSVSGDQQVSVAEPTPSTPPPPRARARRSRASTPSMPGVSKVPTERAARTGSTPATLSGVPTASNSSAAEQEVKAAEVSGATSSTSMSSTTIEARAARESNAPDIAGSAVEVPALSDQNEQSDRTQTPDAVDRQAVTTELGRHASDEVRFRSQSEPQVSSETPIAELCSSEPDVAGVTEASTVWVDRLERRDHGDDRSSPVAISASHLSRSEALPPPSLDHSDFADDFGLDGQYESKLRPWLESLCERHFHVQLEGAEHIPAAGRVLLVANHSRAAVWDGIVLRTALRAHHSAGRAPRWLVDDQQFHAPFLGTFVNRLGAVRACQENAERLLLREELLAVFPEGSKATQRPHEDRHRLQRFGRGGYVKLALRTGALVIPVAIVATDYELAVWRNRLVSASRLLAAPFSALRPGLPGMGALGVPPLSARIRICVGAPIAEISRQDASATRDDGLVHELNECVRGAVQSLVNASLHA